MSLASSAVLLLSVSTLHTHASNQGSVTQEKASEGVREQYIKNIFRTAANLTSNALADVVSREGKAEILLKIRQKLLNASASMGPNAEKYVDLVMEGVERIAYTDQLINPSNIRRDALRQALGKEEEKEVSIKNNLIISIAQKIQTLTEYAFRKNETIEEKQKVMDSIKKRVIESAKKQNIRSDKDNIKPYSELVVEGVEMVLQKKFDNGTNRRLNFESRFSNSENNKKDDEQIDIADDSFETNTLNPLPFTKNPRNLCEVFLKRACSQISVLDKFTCRHNNKIILLQQLCDGVSDCPDNSDEKHCTKNAIKKLHTASRIIAGVEAFIPKRCLKTTLGDKLLTKQNDLFRQILENQVMDLTMFEEQIENYNESDTRNVVYQANMVVHTVGLAIGTALCVADKHLYGAEDVFSRRSGDILDEDLDDYLKRRPWAPPECTCNEQFCVKQNCDPSCEHICQQRHILGRWTCTAVTGNDTVSLDLLCDGKIDCYDESDEADCTTGNTADKFVARDMYSLIIKVLSTKIQVAEFQPVFTKFNSLQESIKELLKHSTEARADALTVKRLREQCFSEIISIFDAIVAKSEIIPKVDDAHVLLVSVKEQLLSALKRSNTGNERIVGSEECLCRKAQCAMTLCSSACVRACTVKSILTEYSCGSESNSTIPIDRICNNKTDCPNGNDEEHCLSDICRNHHLFVLRHEIENLNLKNVQKGSVLGETIKDWQNKTITKLVGTEKTGRSTHRVLQKMVAQSLHGLMMSYASLGEYRRSKAKHSIDEFVVIARLLQNTLKSCTK